MFQLDSYLNRIAEIAMDSQDIMMRNATEYKKYHESFMKNNHGSSSLHVFFCIFFTVQCSVYSSLKLKNCKSYQYFYEYIIIVLPLILAHTVLSDYIYFLNFAIATLLLYEFFQHSKINIQPKCINNKKIYSISIMRGLTYLITVCCILAVDFKDFPRHLAKTENYGYSLMDTGVGLFALISGLVHKNLKNHSLKEIVKGNLKFVTILVFLGAARYFSVKQLDYQEHVTEYGVHWNFFFTIALCKLISTVVLYFSINALQYSFLILLIHEFVLYFGVQDWVFSDTPRNSLVSANREGLSSCLGYVSMYLFAAYMKEFLCEQSATFKIKLFHLSFYPNVHQIILIFGSVSLWTSLYVIHTFRPISRTLANASYCIYLEAILVTVVTTLNYIETVYSDEKYGLPVPKIIENVNSNGLSYFLISNLLTGAINLSMRTLLVSSSITFVILNSYMIISLMITTFINNQGIKL